MKKLILPLLIIGITILPFKNIYGQATGVTPNPQSITICEGDVTTINFTGSGTCPGTYEFQVLDGATVVQPWSTTASYNASNTSPITYTVEVRCNTFPGTVVSDTFLVNVVAEPTVTGNLTICNGDSTVLTANGTGTIEWWDSQTGGTQVSPTNTYTTPNLTNTTTYYTQSSGTTGSGAGKILITECGLEGYAGASSADYLEISNLYATPVNTTGWVAAVSGSYSNINTVNSILWNLPSNFNACSVVSRNDVSGDPNYWGNNILWNPGANTTYRSWAIIIDDLGNVVDFVVWGWTAADIATFNPTINGFPITLGPEWTGNGCDATCGVAGGPQLSIQRIGNNDNNDLNDFVCQASTVDVVNPGLVCGWSPFSCRFPVIVTVEPLSTVTVPADAIYCDGDAIPASNYTSNPAGGTFSWTNSDPTIGLAASGTGNTPAFTATNTGGASVTATITVTPTVNGCEGTPSTYTITVDPTPAAPTAAGATICPNNSTTLTATAPGGTYEWYDAATGGTLLTTGANYTTPVLTATTNYWVQTTVNGCTSPRTMVTVSIASAIVVDAGLDDTICSGNSYNLLVTPNGAGYSYVWDELPANPNFSNIFNPTVSPTVNTNYAVTVTDPSGCTGSDSVMIYVNPVPTVTVPANATYCDGDPVPASTYTSTPAGATFSWTNSDPTIGLAANGTGNTPAFTATNTGGASVTATIVVTPTANGCVGTPSSYDIVVNPIPAAPTAPGTTICPNNSTTLTATAPGGTYEWYDAATGGTLLTTGANYTTPVLTATTNYWVQTTVNGCTSPRTMVTVTVASAIVVNAGLDDTICAGGSYTLLATPNGAGYSYVWDELPANPNFSNIFNPTVSPTVNTTYVVTITDAGGCTGSDSVNIYISPVPTVTVPANATYCDGDPVPASVYTSTPAGATFSWTNSDPTIGLAANGTGNTPAFTATNTGGASVTATITVTPTANGCVGTPSNYDITINPVPTVTVPANVIYCDGDAVPASNFTSAPAGGTFSWTNSDPTIGLAANGTGNTPAFVATNPTSSSVVATITVIPTVNGCPGTPSNYTIGVNPTPTMTTPANITVCNGDAIPISAFTSTPAGATFNWTNSDPTIGLAANGTGNTPAFVATNPSASPATATISITPTMNGCSGSPINYTITVKPSPFVNAISNLTVCNGDLVNPSNFTSTPLGGTFSWNNSNSTIGLAANGTGNTPAFTATNLGTNVIAGNVTVTATVNGCSGPSSSYTITVEPVLYSSTNIAICQGDSILIGGAYYTSAGNYVDTLSTSAGCDSIVTYNVTVNPVPVSSAFYTICLGDSIQIDGNWISTAGSFPYIYTSAAGCDSIVTYEITIDSVPTINIYSADSMVDLGFSTQLTAFTGQPNTTYEWSPPVGVNCIFCQYPTVTPPESMWYYVTVTNDNGCTRLDSVWVEVDPSTNIYVPNIFSPNGDGQNDLFKVRGKGVRQFSLFIYNRWGQVVFESSDINNGWDGTKGGDILNQGVFVYKLNVTMYTGEEYNQTGNITLVR